MSIIPSDILLHLWLAFMLILGGCCVEGIRRLSRHERIVRGDQP